MHFLVMGQERRVIEKTIFLVTRIRTTDTVTLFPHMQILEIFSPQHPVDEGSSKGRHDIGPMRTKRPVRLARRTTNPSGRYDVEGECRIESSGIICSASAEVGSFTTDLEKRGSTQ